MQEQKETLVSSQESKTDKVIRIFGPHDECIKCRQLSTLTETTYMGDDERVDGHYSCEHCGYKQILSITGTFFEWYEKEIKGLNIQRKPKEEQKVVAKPKEIKIKMN